MTETPWPETRLINHISLYDDEEEEEEEDATAFVAVCVEKLSVFIMVADVATRWRLFPANNSVSLYPRLRYWDPYLLGTLSVYACAHRSARLALSPTLNIFPTFRPPKKKKKETLFFLQNKPPSFSFFFCFNSVNFFEIPLHALSCLRLFKKKKKMCQPYREISLPEEFLHCWGNCLLFDRHIHQWLNGQSKVGRQSVFILSYPLH